MPANVSANAPPFALARLRFRFPALGALVGRAALGGEREVALACLVAARLAADAYAPLLPLATEARTTRSAAARHWLTALALPAATRVPLTRLVEATAAGGPGLVRAAVSAAAEAVAPYLDAAARGELEQLARGS
ncbi:MAG TPA: hypothetical protein VNA89_15835 [Gemmatimonadaceae bacterium]|nr:hypothetical protein [Gemmatimonadaceae bacterium]